MARYRVLVAGGGVAALEAALALQHLGEDRVSVALIAPEPRFWYRPLAVVESFGLGRLHGIDLAQLADACGALFVVDALQSVDVDGHLVRTAQGAELEYDALLVATGARPVAAVPGAITFRGPADVEAFSTLLSSLRAGSPARVVFAVPGGVTWPLPLYELALQTAAFLDVHGVEGVELALVTHEETPLRLFGSAASAAVTELLERRRIDVHTGTYAVSFEGSTLAVTPAGDIAADAVVAMPRLSGVPVEGLPHDAEGFIPTDSNGRVRGLDDVFAAGDATAFPIKQGGIAAQQADAAAEAIAAAAGAPVEPEPFRPVLRGLLLTGEAPAFLRTELGGGAGDTSVAAGELLWWPPGKIVGRYLAPFLAERAGAILAPPEGADAVPVDVELASALVSGTT
jgi:sulfide:quinone oxidoreductase